MNFNELYTLLKEEDTEDDLLSKGFDVFNVLTGNAYIAQTECFGLFGEKYQQVGYISEARSLLQWAPMLNTEKYGIVDFDAKRMVHIRTSFVTRDEFFNTVVSYFTDNKVLSFFSQGTIYNISKTLEQLESFLMHKKCDIIFEKLPVTGDKTLLRVDDNYESISSQQLSTLISVKIETPRKVINIIKVSKLFESLTRGFMFFLTPEQLSHIINEVTNKRTRVNIKTVNSKDEATNVTFEPLFWWPDKI